MTAAFDQPGFRLACVLLLAVALGACGKSGSPRPPEGLEREYTYPQFYPAPLPTARRTVAPPKETEEEAAPAEPLAVPTRERRVAPFPLDYSNTRTKTIGTISSE